MIPDKHRKNAKRDEKKKDRERKEQGKVQSFKERKTIKRNYAYFIIMNEMSFETLTTNKKSESAITETK